MINVELEYWDIVRETRRYPSGGYYEHQEQKMKYEESISGNTEVDIFETFYKKNNQLRYCNGSEFKFKDSEWKTKYSNWLNSDDYKSKSFNLYYGNGVVD